MRAFCDIASYNLVRVDRRFRSAYCLHYQSDEFNFIRAVTLRTSQDGVNCVVFFSPTDRFLLHPSISVGNLFRSVSSASSKFDTERSKHSSFYHTLQTDASSPPNSQLPVRYMPGIMNAWIFTSLPSINLHGVGLHWDNSGWYLYCEIMFNLRYLSFQTHNHLMPSGNYMNHLL
jgi:hypothetical protein